MKRLAEVILRLFLPAGTVGESILRDLREEYRLRRAEDRRPGWTRDLWYLKEALLLSGHYAWARVRGGGVSGGTSGPRTLRSNVRRSSAFGDGGRAGLVDGLVRDFLYALRRLRQNPGFAAVALLTMALGIGANVAIFSIVEAVLLRPLPYDEPEELVAVWEWNVPRDARTNVVNPGNWRAWRESAESFQDLAAITMEQPAVLTSPGEPVEITARYMSGNYLPLLGLEPALGRYPEVVPEQEGEPQAVLSHRFWMQHFGGDPEVLGRNITINGLTGVIVGVLPREYLVFGEGVDLLAAYPVLGDQTNTGRFMNVIGRLEKGVTVTAAQEEMEAVAAGLREAYPDFNAGWSATVTPLRDAVVGNVGPALLLLLGAVGLLLLIACANVANLFLARASERKQEIAIRTSLGAGRSRIAGQLLVESLVVSVLGALLGTAGAWWGTGTLGGALPDAFALPRVDEAGVNVSVVTFAVIVTVVTGLLFGVLPALHAARTPPGRALKTGSRGNSATGGRARSALVVTEVALSMMLLVGAALLARSFVQLTAVDPGLDPENLVAARVTLQGPAYQGTDPDVRFFGELMGELEGTPGVAAAGAITFLPFTGLASATDYEVAGRPAPDPESRPVAEVRNVAGRYFEAAGMRLVEGRLLDDRDRADGREVVVVSRALADTHWPGESAIGQRLLLEWGDSHDLAIVGVVDDVLHHGLDARPRATLFLPYAQQPYFPFMHVVVRPSDLSAGQVALMLQETVRALDPSVPVSEVRIMEDVVRQSVARPRMTALLMGVFAILAATLAAVGLYGVLSYTVSRRTREIGVRVALGAEPGRVLRLVVKQGMLMVVGGVVLGVLGSILLGGVIEALLFGVDAGDPMARAGAAGLVLAVALVACALPAFRATRVDPAEALRVQ